MASKDVLKDTSKFLSYVLRHEPGAIGITLDAQGWVPIAELLAAAGRNGRNIDRALLDEVVATSEKKRFTQSEDGTSIRAAQGHSVGVDLELPPKQPPGVLYHGTAEKNVSSILTLGINAGARVQVHLSATTDVARAVGQRHGRPAIFAVDAAGLWRDGHLFYQAENGVWLTDAVPASALALWTGN